MSQEPEESLNLGTSLAEGKPGVVAAIDERYREQLQIAKVDFATALKTWTREFLKEQYDL